MFSRVIHNFLRPLLFAWIPKQTIFCFVLLRHLWLCFYWSPSNHLSSAVWLHREHLEHRAPIDFPIFCNFVANTNLGWDVGGGGKLVVFPVHCGDITSPPGPGSTPRSPLIWLCHEYLTRNTPWWHPQEELPHQGAEASLWVYLSWLSFSSSLRETPANLQRKPHLSCLYL